MKSFTLTMFRLTKPQPPLLRWGVRFLWLSPGFLFLAVFFIVPHRWAFLVGVLTGLLCYLWRKHTETTIKRMAAALMAQRMHR